MPNEDAGLFFQCFNDFFFSSRPRNCSTPWYWPAGILNGKTNPFWAWRSYWICRSTRSKCCWRRFLLLVKSMTWSSISPRSRLSVQSKARPKMDWSWFHGRRREKRKEKNVEDNNVWTASSVLLVLPSSIENAIFVARENEVLCLLQANDLCVLWFRVKNCID